MTRARRAATLVDVVFGVWLLAGAGWRHFHPKPYRFDASRAYE